MSQFEQRERNQIAKQRYSSPELIHLGLLTDLVQGGGKSGGAADADPQSTTKSGVG